MPNLASALNRAWPRRVLALICLVLAAVSALSARAPAASGQRPVNVVVAARMLAAGRVVAAGDLRLARWPAGVAPSGAFRSVDGVVGRRLAGAVGGGDAVTPQRLVGAALTAGLAPGSAAVPVTLADANAANLIHPGDHVDLLVPPDGTDGLPDASTAAADAPAAVVARGLLVLAVLPRTDTSVTTTAEIVVAADEPTELELAGVATRSVFATVRNPP